MLHKLFWLLALLFYGLALMQMLAPAANAGEIVLHWSFWVLLALGTAAATAGNALQELGAPESDAGSDSSEQRPRHA